MRVLILTLISNLLSSMREEAYYGICNPGIKPKNSSFKSLGATADARNLNRSEARRSFGKL